MPIGYFGAMYTTTMLALVLAQAIRPAPQVQDTARFFTPDTIKKANAVMADIKKRYKKDLIVESIKEIPAEWKSKYTPEKKEAFFLKLVHARAEAKKLDGMYILICKRPLWLQLGADRVTEKKAFPKAMQDRLLSVISGKFGKGEYDTGLLELIALIESAFAEVRERGSLQRPERFELHLAHVHAFADEARLGVEFDQPYVLETRLPGKPGRLLVERNVLDGGSRTGQVRRAGERFLRYQHMHE